ncbi:MAG: EamA family transporter, partial [Solirubrobacterales bacterium]
VVLGFALSLASSVSWGLSDFLGGLQSRRMHVLAVVVLSQTVGLLLAVALLPVLGDAGLSAGDLAIAAAGGAAGAVGLIAFYAGMATGTISVVSPIAALGVIVPVVVGLARGEDPAPLQLGGAAVATAAVVLVSYEESNADKRSASLRPILLALVAALGFGCFFVAVDATAGHDAAWTIVGVRMGGVLVAVGAVIGTRPSFSLAAGAVWAILAIGFFDVLANSLYAVATTKGLLPVVAVGGSIYPAVTILLAYLVIGERLGTIRRAGVALALTGIVMIAAGA